MRILKRDERRILIIKHHSRRISNISFLLRIHSLQELVNRLKLKATKRKRF